MKWFFSIAWFFILFTSVYSQSSFSKMVVKYQNEGRVIFMGNSIIQGWKMADPEFFSNPKMINRGIGGQTTPQMLLRFDQDVIDAYPEAVLILAGTNDIAGNTGEIALFEIRDNIAKMAQMAMENNIKVIVCSVLPAFDYPWRPGRHPDKKIPQLNGLLKELAKEKNLYYLDFFTEMADQSNGLPKKLADDGVHPTPEGYAVMKRLTMDAFKDMKLLP
jgi:lysophospholipase L1-like esterase